MDPVLIAKAATKWIHLSSAAIAVGTVVHLRWVVLPALASLPEEVRRETATGLCRKSMRWIAGAFVLLLLTGLDNIGKARKTLGGLDESARSAYWTAFGLKIALFTLACVAVHLLVTGVKKTDPSRDRTALGLGLLAVALLLVVFLSGFLTVTRLSLIPVVAR